MSLKVFRLAMLAILFNICTQTFSQDYPTFGNDNQVWGKITPDGKSVWLHQYAGNTAYKLDLEKQKIVDYFKVEKWLSYTLEMPQGKYACVSTQVGSFVRDLENRKNTFVGEDRVIVSIDEKGDRVLIYDQNTYDLSLYSLPNLEKIRHLFTGTHGTLFSEYETWVGKYACWKNDQKKLTVSCYDIEQDRVFEHKSMQIKKGKYTPEECDALPFQPEVVIHDKNGTNSYNIHTGKKSEYSTPWISGFSRYFNGNSYIKYNNAGKVEIYQVHPPKLIHTFQTESPGNIFNVDLDEQLIYYTKMVPTEESKYKFKDIFVVIQDFEGNVKKETRLPFTQEEAQEIFELQDVSGALLDQAKVTEASGFPDPIPFPSSLYLHPIYDKALKFTDDKDYEKAEVYWDEAILRYPTEFMAYKFSGEAKMVLEKYNEAITNLLQANYLNPFDESTLLNVIYCYSIMKQQDKVLHFSNVLGKVLAASEKPKAINYLNSLVYAWSSRNSDIRALLELSITTVNNAYSKYGSFDEYTSKMNNILELKQSSFQDLEALKQEVNRRELPNEIYHYFLNEFYVRATAYHHLEAAQWAKSEGIREFKNDRTKNYFKVVLGQYAYESMIYKGDFDLASSTNQILVSELNQLTGLQFKRIDLLMQRCRLLFDMGKMANFKQVLNGLLAAAGQYKNPVLITDMLEVAARSSQYVDLDASIEYSKKALQIATDNKLKTQLVFESMLSGFYMDKGLYDEALAMLGYKKDTKKNQVILYNIGSILMHKGKVDEAISYFDESITLIEDYLKTADPYDQLTYSNYLDPMYSNLCLAHAKNNNKEMIYETIERSKSRLLSGQLGATALDANTSKQIMDSQEAYVTYKLVNGNTLLVSVVTNEKIETTTINLYSSLLNLVKKYGVELNQIELKMARDEYRVPELREENTTTFVRESDINLLMELYRQELQTQTSSGSLSSTGDLLSQSFYDMLFAPIEPLIEGKTKMYISADGPIHYLPLGTLRDEQGNFLIEKLNIRLMPSLAILKTLKGRKYSSNRKPVLAFGGAIYNKTESDAAVVSTITEVNEWKVRSAKMVEEGKPVSDIFHALGYGKMNYLQGTLNEVNEIKKIQPEATIIVGENMTEDFLKKQSLSGALKDYKVLHFATHGWAMNSFPSLSGLAMCIPKTIQNNSEDGYLIANEIRNLNIEADLVILSACQTGLGKIYGGEGVSGLNQAYLSAGANATLVTLWPVNDYGTSILMKELYSIQINENISYDEALRKIQINFINGDYNTDKINLSHPIFWAPFIYYGI